MTSFTPHEIESLLDRLVVIGLLKQTLDEELESVYEITPLGIQTKNRMGG